MSTEASLHFLLVSQGSFDYKPLKSQDLISNSPYCLPNDSHFVSLENLVSDQLAILLVTFFFILITCLHDIV